MLLIPQSLIVTHLISLLIQIIFNALLTKVEGKFSRIVTRDSFMEVQAWGIAAPSVSVLGNNIEMKVQGPQDSVARKVMLLNNLSLQFKL